MANKKSTKKKAQQKTEPEANASAKATKAVAKKETAAAVKKADKAKKNGKPGLISRVTTYFKSVRSEMKRVVWPTKKELFNYSVAVCASLIVVGIVIALLDAVIGEGLVLFSSLRG